MKDQDKNKSWDLGKFWQTLTFFEVIPGINLIQKLFSTTPQTKIEPMKHILVAGATGGVGKRVVKLLLQQNYRVRALVRNESKAREMLGDEAELILGDVTQSQTLSAKMLEGVEAIVWCIGTRVQPVEGDTSDRQKYYQGIKFYQPEVVETPQTVEYEGIQNLIALTQSMPARTNQTLFDFSGPSAAVQEIWGAIDDVVMGGVSSSKIKLEGVCAVFTGVVSTENNGGFASVRTRNFDPPPDLSAYEGVELQIRGDGKRYKFIIRDSDRWDGIGYSYSFDTQPDQWITVKIPFTDLIPVFRAKTVEDAQGLNTKQIYSMQLMLSKFEYDGGLNPSFEPGEFRLEVASINAYGGKPKPQFVMISSAGVTRPGRPDLDLSKEPPAVRMNEQLGGLLTWKLRGEEALRQSGLVYTIVRPCALTEKPGDKQLELAQGDEIQGQVSRDAVAQLCIESLELAEAANKTFEVRETATVASNDWSTLLAQAASE